MLDKLYKNKPFKLSPNTIKSFLINIGYAICSIRLSLSTCS